MEIFLFFLGGVLLQKAEDPLKNLPFLTYLFIGLSAVFSGILSKLLHRDGDILTPLITGGILTAISLLLSLFFFLLKNFQNIYNYLPLFDSHFY